MNQSKSRTKKASLNVMTSALLEVATMLSGLILPRFILRYFGSAYNGITSSAAQFLSMISVLTLGVTASTRVALYKTLANKDIAGSSAIVRATERYMRKVALALAAYIVVLALVYPLVVHTGFPYLDVALLILIVGINAFSEYYFGITYRTFLLADQSVYISNIFSTVSVLLNLIVSIILIRAGFRIHVVKLGSAAVYFLRPLLQNIYVTRKYKLDKHCEPDMTALSMRGEAMMHAVANIVHDHTDIIVLTLFTDVKIVSVYTVYNMVMASLKKIQYVFATGTEPIFGDMWVKGETAKIRKTVSFYELFANVSGGLLFSVAMVMILPFISLYVPKNVTDVEYIQPAYAIVISLAFATQGMRLPYYTLVHGIGHYKQTRNAAITEAVINIVVSVLLVNIIGMVGVAIGTLVANLYRSIQYAFYIDNHVFYRGKRVIIGKLCWALLNMLVIVVPAYWVVHQLEINGWLPWIGISLAVALYGVVVLLASSWLFYRDDCQYALILGKRVISQRLHRKK